VTAVLARVVAFPTEVTSPVKLAFVVTVQAVSPAAVPVIFVPTRADGVPRSGVTRTGELALTSHPVPVEVAPQRVFTISPTVASSRTVAAAAVIVMFASGIVIVFSVVVGQAIFVNPLPVPPYVEAIT
jgi:hypothetical protein